MTLGKDWFTERDSDTGTAFSLKLGEHVHSEKTPFQQIDIYRTATFGYLMAIDGFTMVSSRENFFYHEMMSHPVLNAHPDPKRVVIVGGGDCGTLCEVLKHPEVERATQVEIDERVTRLSEQYFPELCARNDDPRAELLFVDAIQWMKDAEAGSLDVVIIDSTDPIGPAEGLFGKAFYDDVLRALKPDGLMVQQSESPFLHLHIIRDMHVAMREAGFAQMHLLQYPQLIYPSGWWSATLASKQTKVLEERLDEADIKRLQTRYYNRATHRAAFAVPNYVAEVLDRI